MQTNLSKQGFTLVEVLVALVVSTLAVGMFAYFVDSLILTRTSQQEAAAAAYARTYLEGLEARWQYDTDESYRNLGLAADLPAPPPSYEASVTVADRGGNTLLMATYPSSAATTTDRTPLRSVLVTLTDDEGQVVQFETQVALPPPR